MAIPTLSWQSQLLPASFRGVPFVTEQSGFSTSRKWAIHEYPFKDNPVAEDLGRANQTLNFSGFLVGDDCYLQRDALASACQAPGTGILIHPSLTFIPSVACLSATFNERADRGRVVEVQFSFLVVDDIPVLQAFDVATSFFASSPTLSLVATAVATVASASKAAFATILNPASLVIGLVGTTLNALGGFTSRLTQIIDPTAVFNAINGMQVLADPSFTLSRYITGNVNGSASQILAGISTTLSPADRISQATQAVLDNTVNQRQALLNAIDAAIALASSDPSGAYLGGIYGIPQALAGAINEPSDQIRVLSGLASYEFAVPMGTASPTSAVLDATSSAVRKGVLMSLATACSQYQPDDSQDVNDILNLIIPLFDAEILYAADSGDVATYNALIGLRAAVVNDLQVRGSQLPSLITITETDNLPSVVMAYRLYNDSTRDAEVVQRVNPIHPLFLPKSFQVLSF